eukprot:gene9767-7647_t
MNSPDEVMEDSRLVHDDEAVKNCHFSREEIQELGEAAAKTKRDSSCSAYESRLRKIIKGTLVHGGFMLKDDDIKSVFTVALATRFYHLLAEELVHEPKTGGNNTSEIVRKLGGQAFKGCKLPPSADLGVRKSKTEDDILASPVKAILQNKEYVSPCKTSLADTLGRWIKVDAAAAAVTGGATPCAAFVIKMQEQVVGGLDNALLLKEHDNVKRTTAQIQWRQTLAPDDHLRSLPVAHPEVTAGWAALSEDRVERLTVLATLKNSYGSLLGKEVVKRKLGPLKPKAEGKKAKECEKKRADDKEFLLLQKAMQTAAAAMRKHRPV